MSKLFKSKLAFGLVVALALVVATTASAYTFTKTIKKGSYGPDVQAFQQVLNGSGYPVSSTGAGSPGNETMSFGSKTTAAAKLWQAANGLVADGVIGAKSRAVLNGGMTSTSTVPGCAAGAMYSSTTGAPCSGSTVTLPAGCTSTAGYSTTTGQKCDGTTSTTVNSGAVSAMLASTNPASSTLVAGQATADLLHLGFTGTGTVTNVVLKRIGVSADSTPSNVYLFDGAMRLTDAASVSNTGMVTFNNAAGLFTVNGAKTVAVKSDIAALTSGQTVGFQLVSFTVTGGSATTSTLSGNIHTIASSTLASVSAGTVTPSGATLNPGAGVTVWQSTLTVSTRDVLMKRISLRNIGSATASAFSGFKLYVNGVQVGTASNVDANGYVTFDFMSNPVLLASGSRVVRLDADIVSGASRTVKFSLRQAADVDFVDSSFGVNITPTSTPWASSSDNTISGTSGGSLTIEKDVTSPSTNVVNGANDAVLGVFKLTAYGEPIKVETLRVAYTGSANIDDDDDSLRNARIMIGGSQYGSTASLNETTDGTLAYTSYTLNYTVVPGTPVLLEVRADVYDGEGTNDIVAGTDTITAVIAVGSSNAMRVDSLGSFNAPGTAVTANTLTVASTSVTLTKNSTYANQTTTLPVTAFKIGSWNLAGSSVEDVLLTTMSFDVDEVTNATFSEADLTNMYVVVKNGSTVVAQPSPLATVAAADNNFSINYTLPKNQSVTIELFANLGSTVTAGDSFKTDLGISGTSMTSGTTVLAGDNNADGDIDDTADGIDGQTIISGTATITATTDASTPVASVVYDNQTVTAAAFKFASVYAGFNVTDLTFTLANATVAQTVELYDGATMVASKPGASTVTFNGLSWNVPSNTNKVLTVKLVLGSIGVGAGTSGSSQLVTLTDFTATNTANGVSDASGNDAGPSIENGPTGNAMYAYAAIPSVQQVALPNTTMVAGTNTIAKFTVTANGGSVAWKELLLDINKSAAPTLSSVTLWDVTGSPTQVTAATAFQNGTAGVATTCVADNTFCELLVTVGAKSDDNVEQQVGTTKTYEVRATIGGTLAADVYVSATLTSNLTYVAPAVFTTADNSTAANNATFVWSDMSAQSHDTGTADWSSEYLLTGVPTAASWTLTY